MSTSLYITREEAQRLSDERLQKYCKLITVHTKNEQWFHYTHFILNITVMIALLIFFERMYKYSNEEIRQKCKNNDLHANLNNVLAAFFVINIIVQIINGFILAFSNFYIGRLYKCNRLLSEAEQQIVHKKKNTMFVSGLVIRIVLMILVLILLIYGLYLWGQCGKNEKLHPNVDIYTWYYLFSKPTIFKENSAVNSDNSAVNSDNSVNLQYEYTNDYKEMLKNIVSNKSSLPTELTKGEWIINNDIYYYDGESYDKDDSTLYLKSKDGDKAFLNFQFSNKNSNQIFQLLYKNNIYTFTPPKYKVGN